MTTVLLLCAGLSLALSAPAQPARQDAIWARSTNGAPIVLDGRLNEAVWAQAESLLVRFGVDNGIPGSGYKPEGGFLPTDPTFCRIKFLRNGNQLYMGFVARDSSIGGGVDFNRFDAFLMGLKDRSLGEHPAPVAEYFMAWWDPGDSLGTKNVGGLPNLWGRWGGTFPRTAEQIAAWDAAVTVQGLSNTDVGADTSYTVEMRFDLGVMGYDYNQAGGDCAEWNIDIYDCDWFWPIDFWRFSANRSWLQDPWGNTSWFDEMRIWGRSDVTVSSGPVPTLAPELRVANAASYPAPVIDGQLTDAVYASAPKVDIRYDDTALRDTYGNPGKWRSGQYEPPINGNQPPVSDPGDATVYYFFRADSLYLGFDVRDTYVQPVTFQDRWDGVLVSLNERVRRGPDNNLLGQKISFIVGPGGQAVPQDSLPALIARGAARVAMALKPGTTVDSVANGNDAGWTAELILDLTKFGYPAGRGDGLVFLGVDLYDGDTFPLTPALTYGTRTWWWREHEGKCCPPWGYMDPNLLVVGVGDEVPRANGFALLGNFPNPYREGTLVRYNMPSAGHVVLEVYDVRGRKVLSRDLGLQMAGVGQAEVGTLGVSGVHFYRLRFTDPRTGAEQATLSGKLMVLD